MRNWMGCVGSRKEKKEKKKKEKGTFVFGGRKKEKNGGKEGKAFVAQQGLKIRFRMKRDDLSLAKKNSQDISSEIQSFCPLEKRE